MDPRRYPSILAAITALTAQACGQTASTPDSASNGAAAAGAAGRNEGGSSSSGGSAGNTLFGVDAGGLRDCPKSDFPFEGQPVSQIGEQRVFYSWTTEEQVAELRAGTELFSRSERAGQGRGLLFTELAAFAQGASAPQKLADKLANETFAKARFAWPNPWATLLGLSGETYGNQLLKIELSAEAWIAHFDRYGISVFDQHNAPVPIEMALENPQRVGAIFYQSSGEPNSAQCGTFSQGAVGFREFALGNLAMVTRWSLATAEIGERMKSDIAELRAFEQQLACAGDTSSWLNDISCAWSEGFYANSARDYYDFSIALPSELYRPSATNLEALIAALEANLPTGEPLDVILVK
ncbi:MAG TPA: hypothetical protein VGC79_17685 [Polyangiaceae bacterium]